MIALFQKRSPVNVLLLLIFAVAVKLPLFLHPQLPKEQAQDAELYRWLVHTIAKSGTAGPLIFSVLTLLLFYTQALLLNYFFQQHKMVNRPTDLPGMSLLLISSLIPEWSYFNPALLVSLITMYLLFSLFRLYNQADVPRLLFNMGLAVGLGCFLYLPTLVIGLWLLMAILIMRSFRLQEILLPLLGMFTPFYFYGVWLFWKGQWHSIPWLNTLDLHIPGWHSGAWVGGAAFLLLLPLLMGAYSVQDNSRKMLIQVRRGWTVLTFLLLTTVLIPFLHADSLEGWLLALIPLAAYHACFYLYTSFRIIPLLFFWLSFFFVVITQFSGTAG